MNALAVATGYWLLQVFMILVLKHWLNRRRKSLNRELGEVFQASPQDEEPHTWTLRYVAWRRTGAWLLSLFAALVIYAILIHGNWSSLDDAESSVIRVFGPLFCVAGITPWYFVIVANGVTFFVNDRGIARRTPILKAVFIDWNEIQGISYSPHFESFVIRGTESKITLLTSLENIDQFARLALRRVPEDKRQAANMMLARALRGPFRR